MTAPCPYEELPDTSYWAKAVRDVDNQNINPAVSAKFSISKSTKIGTIGSCFAQNISQHLVDNEFNFFVTEGGPSWLSETEKRAHGYGIFSARYGNVYNTLQMLQLVRRATGDDEFLEEPWRYQNGYADPFRPHIEPEGFASLSELDDDRTSHLRFVRQLFTEVDVLVITLGLTETWVSKKTNAAFPVCPGCGAGNFDSSLYEYKNFSVSNVISHLEDLASEFRALNENGKIILTVSPVPLVATYEAQHVLQSTVYSKSVLRAAAGEIASTFDFIDYFPSYEIITWTYSNAEYFRGNKRSVTSEGVNHVMRCFFSAYADFSAANSASRKEVGAGQSKETVSKTSAQDSQEEVICDEDRLLEMLGQEGPLE